MHRVADHGRRGAAHPRVVGRRTARQAAGPGMITGLGRERTLRHDEFAALAALSRRPVAELDTMPVSPGRFLAATGHDTLLDAWGVHGIAEAVGLVRGSSGTAA